MIRFANQEDSQLDNGFRSRREECGVEATFGGRGFQPLIVFHAMGPAARDEENGECSAEKGQSANEFQQFPQYHFEKVDKSRITSRLGRSLETGERPYSISCSQCSQIGLVPRHFKDKQSTTN